MKNIVFLVAIVLSTSYSKAQDYPITDRSLGYATAYTMPDKTVQLESGYFYLNDLSGSPSDLSGQALLMRFGFKHGIEFRARMGLQQLRIGNLVSENIAPLELSIKKSIFQEGKYSPSLYLLAQYDMTPRGNGTGLGKANPSIRLITEKYINEILIIGANIGYTWIRSPKESSVNYTLSARIALAPSVSLYGEFWGRDFSDLGQNNYAGGAIEFWLWEDFVFDLALGSGVSEGGDGFYWSAGLVYRMN